MLSKPYIMLLLIILRVFIVLIVKKYLSKLSKLTSLLKTVLILLRQFEIVTPLIGSAKLEELKSSLPTINS